MAQTLQHVELVAFSLPGETFFTIHSEHHLLYVSEVAVGLEPPFGVFLLPGFSARAKSLTFKLWLRNAAFPNWKLWYHMDVTLAALIPVPLPALGDRSQFAKNTVLWYFGSSHYCLPSQIVPVGGKCPRSEKSAATKPSATKLSLTLDDLRQLMTLHSGVRELSQAKQTLSGHIDDEIAQNTDEPVPVRLRALKFRLHALHKYVARQRTINDALQSQIYSKKLLISKGLLVIEEEYPQFQEIAKERLAIAEAQVMPLFDLLHQSVYPNMLQLLASAATVLQQVFPIELVLATGRLSISGVAFPSSVKEVLDVCYYGGSEPSVGTEKVISPDQINAGLSFIVLLLRHLASLVNTPLKYHMRFVGSECLLTDTFSVLAKGTPKVLPLYYDANQTEKYALYDSSGRGFVLSNAPFERSLALLSKNVAVLIRAVAALYAELAVSKDNDALTNIIPVDCADNFLWNLQCVLLYMTAPEPA